MVRAFHIAGSHNVLTSLWKVNDTATAEFMRRFYGTWLDGSKPKDLAVALREVQLSFLKDPDSRLHDPKYWAPLVLVEAR